MNNKIIKLFIYFSFLFSENNNYYVWPTSASETLTDVFGEDRSRRFHAGIDVRTYGKIGDPLFAIYNGYVSRIKISPDGYGKTLYLKLEDGNTAVYAHIDKFQESIEQKIILERQNANSSFIDIYLKKNELKFSKGDIVGYAGDTGSISGPHLHFEIRDENNNPLNPLIDYYTIEDSLKPVAKSLAFIPLDNSCWINGVQNYSIFKLEKLNEYKYVLQDTISILGNFGLAIEVEDKINDQPFNYNIFKMDLSIDNKLVYKIKFDKYNMKHDHLIYNEIDYNLLTTKNRTFHRLYVNNNLDLNFIDNKSSNGYNVNSGYHYLNINISDINDNKIQIQGIIKGDLALPKKIKKDKNKLISNDGFDNLILNYTTRFDNSRLIPMSFKQIDSNVIEFNLPEKPYEVIEYYSSYKNGLNSKKGFIDIYPLNPYKINGDFEFIFFDNGIIIQFNEEQYSGYTANIITESENDTIKYKLYRNTKNILSTPIINYSKFNKIDNITVKYETVPEIIFSKSINGNRINKNIYNEMYHREFKLESFKNSLHNDIFVIIEDTIINFDTDGFEEIISPIKIMPDNISFNDFFSLSCNKEINQGAIFNFNKKKNKWYYMEKQNNLKSINTKLFSGGIFAVLNEQIKPDIKNIFPANEATYDSKDVTQVLFNTYDKHSGLNHNKTLVKINGESLFYDCIKYRELIRADINFDLNQGKNILEILVEDKMGNETYIQNTFYLK